jgi:hypothetical protein
VKQRHCGANGKCATAECHVLDPTDCCPADRGLCPEHKQHACLGIIEVNTGCNLDCPICFADSGHQPDGYSITIDRCERLLAAETAGRDGGEVGEDVGAGDLVFGGGGGPGDLSALDRYPPRWRRILRPAPVGVVLFVDHHA